MTTRDEIYETLCRLLGPFNTSQVEIKPDTDISADLSIDSVSVMDFVMEVEDHFEVDIPLNVLSETHTVDDLIDVVQSQLRERAPS